MFHSASPFSDWLRALPPPYTSSTFSAQNLDYFWHAYKDDWFIAIEEKRNGARRTFSQRDTHDIVDQMLKFASGNEFMTARGKKKKIEYRGYYVLSFEHNTPEDSAWVRINGTTYSKPADRVKFLLLHGRVV